MLTVEGWEWVEEGRDGGDRTDAGIQHPLQRPSCPSRCLEQLPQEDGAV